MCGAGLFFCLVGGSLERTFILAAFYLIMLNLSLMVENILLFCSYIRLESWSSKNMGVIITEVGVVVCR